MRLEKSISKLNFAFEFVFSFRTVVSIKAADSLPDRCVIIIVIVCGYVFSSLRSSRNINQPDNNAAHPENVYPYFWSTGESPAKVRHNFVIPHAWNTSRVRFHEIQPMKRSSDHVTCEEKQLFFIFCYFIKRKIVFSFCCQIYKAKSKLWESKMHVCR